MGGKMSPSAVLVIQNGNTRLVSLKEGTTYVDKIINAVPVLLDKFADMTGKKKTSQTEMSDDEVKEAVKNSSEK
jgi:uncharacterized spore protein YtfJ